MAFQCEEDILLVEDELNTTYLLGRWEITDETVNGVQDLLPKCCEFFEFNINNKGDDLIGNSNYTDSAGINNYGIFTVDTINQTITFEQEGEQPITYNYTLNTIKKPYPFF